MNNAELLTGMELMREARLLRFEDPPHAHQLSARAVELFRDSVEGPLELIAALKLLGQIERDAGKLEKALTLYQEAVVLCRATDDSLLLAHTIRHVGDIHQDAGRHDLAEPCYQEALSIYRNQQNINLIDLANAVRPLGLLRATQGETVEAKRLFAEARDLYQACNIKEGVAEMSRRLAQL